jgi:hypothetical protein
MGPLRGRYLDLVIWINPLLHAEVDEPEPSIPISDGNEDSKARFGMKQP